MAPPLYHKIIHFQFSIQNYMVFHISGYKPTVFICNFIHFKLFNTCIVKISSCHAKIFDIFLCFNLMILFICKEFFNFLHCCISSGSMIRTCFIKHFAYSYILIKHFIKFRISSAHISAQTSLSSSYLLGNMFFYI